MSEAIPGLGGASEPVFEPARTEFVMIQQPLRRVLAFTRRSIDDVVNDPIARREVLGYYKLYCWIRAGCEIVELEQQWNPIGLRR